MTNPEQPISPFYPYPSRSGMDMNDAYEKLNAEPEFELSVEQKEEVRNFESELTNSPDGLEAAWKLTVNTTTLYPEYFQTEDGRADYLEVFGDGLADDKTEIDEIAVQLYETDYSFVDSGELARLSGKSKKYVRARVVKQFAETNYTSVENVDNPELLTVIRNPEVLAEKITRYRVLKNKHREMALDLNNRDGPIVEAQKVMLTIHRRRLNQLIAEEYPTAVHLLRQERNFGEGGTSVSADKIEENLRGLGLLTGDSAAKSFARLDKFRQGVGDNDSDGNYSQVSRRAMELADSLYKDAKPMELEEYVFKDVDRETIVTTEISADEWSAWAKKALDHYGLLSDQEEYDFDRQGRAKDNKWQVIVSPKASGLSVNGRQGVVFVPESFKRPLVRRGGGIGGAAPILDHEMCHVVQHENKSKLGLAITENVGMDRPSVMFEGGAVAWESQAQERLFGLRRPVGTAYLKAIQEKLRGGSYRESMLSYFDEHQLRNPSTSKERSAEVATGSTSRLFRMGGSFNDISHHLSNSQPLVYLEQEMVARQLADVDQTDAMMIGGSNIEMLAELQRVGMLDKSNITNPSKRPTEIVGESIRKKVLEAQK